MMVICMLIQAQLSTHVRREGTFVAADNGLVEIRLQLGAAA